ncbi:MAG: ribosome maturation factor RimM [Lachnospiraceae bacterium]|nr:ribosome maturation factor RimM [Lachnospiraceae bacterium]
MKSEYLRVGVITTTHGVKGEVKIFPTTDDIERFDYLKTAYIDTGKELKKVTVTGVKYFKNQAILKFEEINNINDVLCYKGKDLLVSREDAVELEEGEHFITDIIGSKIVTDEGKELGILDDVMETGANDVYVVKDELGKEILLPAIADVILNIDEETMTITVHLLPGLID